jgi:2-dehydropantoate 2-reductase
MSDIKPTCGVIPHIVVVGAGGVGCWVYASIADAVRRDAALARVTLVARGGALCRAREHGLEYSVRSAAGDDEQGSVQHVVVGPGEICTAATCAALKDAGDAADFVILCVKTWQVPEAAKDAALVLKASGCIVTTQNGVNAPAEAAAEAAAAAAAVLVGIAKVIAFREDAQENAGPLGCVRLGAPSPKTIMLGEFGGQSCESTRVSQLRDILGKASIDVPIPEDGNIKRELWRKVLSLPFSPFALSFSR